MKKLTRKAYAKVNLCLDVVRRREDGYHEVRMIMQNLNLYDELIFSVKELSSSSENDSKVEDISATDGKATNYVIKLTTNRDDIPCDERNLVYKAIAMMCEKYQLAGVIEVDLQKHIPVEAGMAGGSTDCAAAMHAVNELFELNLSVEELQKLGVKIGADVPYCILAATALSEGIGEILTKVTPLTNCYVLVAKPAISVSTKMVYTNLKANELEHHPDVDGMIEALDNQDVFGVAKRMENVLETVTVDLYPELENIKNAMKEKGALNSIMSGSGPTIFGLYDSKEACENAAKYIEDKELAKEVYVTEPVSE